MTCRRAIHSQQGSVSIESAFLLTLLLIACTFFIEYSSEKVLQTQLERVNFSLAKIIRERSALYEMNSNTSEPDWDNLLSEQDVVQLADIGKLLMRDSLRHASDFTLKVEAVSFEQNKSQLRPHKVLSYTVGTSCAVINENKLEDLGHLSAWSANLRWMPLYRVSICLPSSNFGRLKKYASNIHGLTKEFSVSNIVLSR